MEKGRREEVWKWKKDKERVDMTCPDGRASTRTKGFYSAVIEGIEHWKGKAEYKGFLLCRH